MINLNGMRLCENCFEEMNAQFCTRCRYNPAAGAGDPTVLAPGSVLLGKYIVGKVIGKGGFGVTYLAYDFTLGKKVAIKEFFPYGVALRAAGTTTVAVSSMDNAEAFKLGAEKFYNEAKLVSKFNGNPNIVGVYEFFYENDTVYFAMEYLKGHTLKEHIQKHGPLSAAQALFVAQNVANALMAAHSSSVLHRDISPDNIIICDDGNIKLIDFGAARQVVAEHSQSFSVILKPGFAPLEQYQKKGNQGPWTDIYSLGATIYYALTEDIPEDPMSRLEDDKAYRSNQYHIDPELWSMIFKATELKIENRYGDIFQFKNDLAKVSAEAEPLVVPKEEPAEKMPEFQTAMPYGMTQIGASQPEQQPVGGGAPVLAPAPSSAPVGAVMSGHSDAENVQPAPEEKSGLAKFLTPKMAAICGAVLAAVVVVIIIPIMLVSNHDNEIEAGGNGIPSKPTTSSTGSGKNGTTQVTNKDIGGGYVYSGEWAGDEKSGYPQGYGQATLQNVSSFYIERGTYDGGKLSEGECFYIESDYSSYSFTSGSFKNGYLYEGYNEYCSFWGNAYALGTFTNGYVTEGEYLAVDPESSTVALEFGSFDNNGYLRDGYQIDYSSYSGSLTPLTHNKVTNGEKQYISPFDVAKFDELKKYTPEYILDVVGNHYGYLDAIIQIMSDAEAVWEPSQNQNASFDNNNSSGTSAASTSSAEEVEAANSTARSLKKTINERWKFAAAKGYGMKYTAQKKWDRIEISVDKSGNWSLTGIDPDHFATDGNYAWSASASGVNGDTDYSDDATVNFLIALANEYPDMKNAAIYAVLESGTGCIFTACTSDTDSGRKLAAAVEDMVGASGKVVSADPWDGKTAGVTSDGFVVGTSPVVGLK